MTHRTVLASLLMAFGLCAAGVAGAAAGAAGAPAETPDRRAPTEHAADWLYQPPAPLSALAEQGRRLYLDGVRADGRPLRGMRALGQVEPMAMTGATVACVQCHRRSGLGTVEGDLLVAPITGRALYQPGTLATVMDTRSRKLLNTAHEPYTIDTLAVALRSGRHISGRELNGLMPRYELADGEVQALDAYLRTLSATWSPGVGSKHIRIASVITPDVDPARRALAADMLKTLVSRKNLGTRPNRRHMVGTLEFVMRSERHWDHEVWELTGPSDTWLAQLRERQARNPVFAIASGVMRDGGPLHAFCQSERVPCWFPVAETLPASATSDFYGLYFNAGVGLEAEVLAQPVSQHLAASEAVGSGLAGALRRVGRTPPQLVQLVSADASAQAGASRLAAQLAAAGQAAPGRTLALGQLDDAALAATLATLRADDALVLWLRPDDLRRVTALAPAAAPVWLAGEMSGGERAPVSIAWRAQAVMAYPYELPSQRAGNLAGLKSWLSTVNKPLVDEALQSQLYFAMTYLSETVADLLHNLHGDYLVERAEVMLGQRELKLVNAQLVAQRSLRRVALDLRQAREQAASASAVSASASTDAATDAGVPQVSLADLTAAREGNTVFPRLNLAAGQRVASKGAWLVRLAADGSAALQSTDAQWVTP
ncbi:MAG: hypothetical protein AB9M60_20825 [Leptothrix sp. (in: b-proteobacteria)]